MGYDLHNSVGAYHNWNSLGWWHLLHLARQYGWMPRGTERPRDWPDAEKWNGSYFRNAGQIVIAEDASALAESLARMMNDPGRQERANRLGDQLNGILGDPSITSTTGIPQVLTDGVSFIRRMLAAFGGTAGRWEFDEVSNEHLGKFIVFCRQGPLKIE
jgi:hypothetical protein